MSIFSNYLKFWLSKYQHFFNIKKTIKKDYHVFATPCGFLMFKVSFKNRLLLNKNFIGEKIDEKPTKKNIIILNKQINKRFMTHCIMILHLVTSSNQ